MSIRVLLFAALLLVLFSPLTGTAQEIWFVDDDGDPGNGCTSWDDACPELQTALTAASAGDEIWVATGTYTPDYDVSSGKKTGDRAATFQLSSGVVIYGGFDGTETTFDKRAGLFDQTILSGDLNADDVPAEFPAGPSYSENSFHVVTGTGANETALLDGFTIKGGHANGSSEERRGGGMYTKFHSNPRVSNILFIANRASIYGGGMYNTWHCNLVVENCSFVGNSAQSGAGMYNRNGSSVIVTNCNFGDNAADYFGGGLYNATSNSVIRACSFTDNVASWGAGLRSWGSSPLTVEACVFTGNVSDSRGGAMHISDGTARIDRCTFEGNSADAGGALSIGFYGDVSVIRSTFTGNSASNTGGAMRHSFSTVTVLLCQFTENTAWRAGGIYTLDGSTTVAGCAFIDNAAGFKGGVFEINDDSVFIINSTFEGNTAAQYGGVLEASGSEVSIASSILWGNSSPQIAASSGVTLDYCDVEGGWKGSGTNNIDADPLFLNADAADLRLSPGSPCIDAGDNTSIPPDHWDLDEDGDVEEPMPWDLAENPRVVDDLGTEDSGNGGFPFVDMGAHEFGSPDCNENGVLDSLDIENESSLDCSENGVPDECEEDCNENKDADVCEIESDETLDCTGNGILDECEADCDDDGEADSCEIADGSADCNLNGVPDECDIESATSSDCNENDVPDECELDCNLNGIADSCDITAATSLDENFNGTPDECEALILYVDADATGQNAGTSWANAYIDLQDALLVASNIFNPVGEIWVADTASSYTPDRGTGDRSATFQLLSGVILLGGFSGGESDAEERDPTENVTILSGDLLADDAPDFLNRSDNSYHVVTGTGTLPTAVLDGFVIQGGNANGPSPENEGGGLLIHAGGPTIVGCVFTGNQAIGDEETGGGAIAMLDQADPTISRCIFHSNRTDHLGGGVYIEQGVSPIFVNSKFVGNNADEGGGLYIEEAVFTVANCTFFRNLGGGIFLRVGSITLQNSIFWDNGGTSQGNQLDFLDASFYPSHCCIQGLIEGGIWDNGTNIGDDPRFVDADGADDIPGNGDDNLRLSPCSPAVDSGTNDAVDSDFSLDLDANARIVDGDQDDEAIVDMGAYEFQAESTCCPADLDGNGSVGPFDLAILLGFWGPNPGHPADLDGDGIVGPFDLALLLGAWGPCD